MKKHILIILISFYSYSFGQEILLINSEYIPYTDTTYVFLPKTANKTDLLPAIIMMHGWAGSYKQWNEIIDLQNIADSLQFIIICPDGFYDSYYINSPIRQDSQFESFFWENFIPAIFNKYPIDKTKLFITGLSMGGHGAISLYLKRPDMFLSAASTSGLLDLTAFPNRSTIKGAAGDVEDYSNVWKENSAINLLSNIAGKNKTIYIDCGTEDFLYQTNIKFKEQCEILGIKISSKFQPGTHDKEYWNKSIKDHFSFFSYILKK
ncbi:MAG: alpha/beta hydrolase family protein [bacterium]